MSHESGQKVLKTHIMPLDADMLDVDNENLIIKSVTVATDRVIGTANGEERLLITEEALDLEVFRATGLSILMGHETNGVNLGKVVNPQIINGKLKGDLAFDKEVPEAIEIFNAIARGFAKDLSIAGYSNRSESTRMGKSTGQSVVITNWEPRDVSFVGLGADPGCGVYRKASQTVEEKAKELLRETKGKLVFLDKTMTLENKAQTKAQEKDQATVKPESKDTKIERSAPAPVPAEADSKEKAGMIERAGVKVLAKLAKDYNVTDSTFDMWIDKGYTEDQAKLSIFDGKIERAQTQTPARFVDNVAKPANPHTENGVSLTMRSAISAAVKQKAGLTNFTKAEGLACEVSQDFQDDWGGPGFRIPYTADIQRAAFTATGNNSAGANFVTTAVKRQDLEKFLYENTVTEQLNIKTRTGQTALYQVPIIESVGKAAYRPENSAATESDTTASNLLLSPIPVVAMKSRTNLSEILAPGSTQELQDELMEQIRIAVDQAILVGIANGPTGIAETTGVDLSGSAASTGLALKSTGKTLEMDVVRNVMSKIRAAKVKGPLSIVTTEAIANYWANKTVSNNNNTLLWARNADTSTVDQRPGFIQNVPVYVSYNLKATDAEADNRTIIGAFQYCYSIYWGQSMKLTVGEQAGDYESDRMSFRLVSYHNTAVSRAAAFGAYKGIKTGS